MAIKVKTQKSYYVTEFNLELPSHAGELDDTLKAIQTTGKSVTLYNDGSVLGINVEQKEKIPSDAIDQKIRDLLGLDTKFL
jgi:hypothetical protein